MKNFIKLIAIGFLFIACTKQDILEGNDIDYPIPVIETISAKTGNVGGTITITGKNFGKIKSVSIGTPLVEGDIVSSTDTEIRFKMPRNFNTGPIEVTTLYKQKATSEDLFVPIYLDATVTTWPSKITRGEPIIIRGTNLDMITEVDINGTKIAISPTKASPMDQLIIPIQGLTLPDNVMIKITKALGKIENGTSSSIAVENPGAYFIPEAPIVIFDFEDNVDPYTAGDIATTHGINKSTVNGAGRGVNYFTLKADNVPSSWNTYLGGIDKSNIDVSKFHKPYLTFLVNTNGNEGYFQLALTQKGVKAGTNFTAAATGVSSDNYKFKTNGWEWRTIPLEIKLDDWGNGSYTFDKNSIIQNIQLSFKQGNGKNPFEINLDQIMITDGPQKPIFMAYNFEDGINPYPATGTASSGLNLSGISPISGAKYLTVRKSGVAKFDWTGEIIKNGPIDLSKALNPYINFWVNTNGKKGFFQFETIEGGIKWGGNLNTTDYLIQTNGWKLISLRLADIQWSKWGGSGTATTLNPKGSMDYLKIGFTTGNVTGEYEVNIDDIAISDGPMF